MADGVKIANYRDLQVWQKAMGVAEHIYRITESFPKHQLYGLTSQMQRAVVSICSNIAEGHNRRSTKEFLYFIRIAQGSLAELETQLLLSHRFNYVNKADLDIILTESTSIGKMLWAMSVKLNAKL